MAGSFLQRLEIDAVGSPIDEARVFVELRGEIADVGGSCRGLGENFVDIDDRDVAVGVIEVGRGECGGKGELLAVGREDGAAVGTFERDDFVDGIVVSEVGDVNVFVAAKCQERIRCQRNTRSGVESGDQAEAGYVELFVAGDLTRFRGQEIRLRGGDIDGPDLTLLVVLFKDFVVAVLLFPIFVFLRFFGGRGECDLLAVFGPVEILNVAFVARELPGFAAFG